MDRGISYVVSNLYDPTSQTVIPFSIESDWPHGAFLSLVISHCIPTRSIISFGVPVHCSLFWWLATLTTLSYNPNLEIQQRSFMGKLYWVLPANSSHRCSRWFYWWSAGVYCWKSSLYLFIHCPHDSQFAHLMSFPFSSARNFSLIQLLLRLTTCLTTGSVFLLFTISVSCHFWQTPTLTGSTSN